jgi:hypothetical protein
VFAVRLLSGWQVDFRGAEEVSERDRRIWGRRSRGEGCNVGQLVSACDILSKMILREESAKPKERIEWPCRFLPPERHAGVEVTYL